MQRERERERERERTCFYLLHFMHFSNGHRSQVWDRLKPGTSNLSPTKVVGAQVLETSFEHFQMLKAKQLGTDSTLAMGWWHDRQLFNPACHNTAPMDSCILSEHSEYLEWHATEPDVSHMNVYAIKDMYVGVSPETDYEVRIWV